MAPLITTYKNDYIDPKQMALSVTLATRAAKQAGQAKAECDCPPPSQLDRLNESAGATAEGIGKSEWTGIAPMGILIKPRVITGADGESVDPDADGGANSCKIDKPNKYLDNLDNTYPDLYDKLKRMNKDDLQKIINTDRLRSTYQADYGGMAEFPSGTYDEPTEEDKDNMIRTFRTELSDPCGEDAVFKDYRSRIKRCGYKPPRRASVCIRHCPVARGHFQAEEKEVPGSEYTRNISHLGGVIMKNRLNDHCKCKPANCKHAIMYSLLTT